MSHVQIDQVTPRIIYSVGGAQSVFTVPFSFFSTTDLVVSNVDTILTLDVDYTVTPETGFERGFPGGTVTLTNAVSSTVITIERDIPIFRVVDFPNSGPLSMPSLNTELDRGIAIDQQLEMDIADANDRVTAVEGLIDAAFGSPLGIDTYATRSAAVLATVSGTVTYLRTAGYATVGDGGAGLYKRVGGAPSHAGYFQSGDGAFWELQGPEVTLENFGAKGDGTTDDRTAIVNAFSSHVAMGGARLLGRKGKTYKIVGDGITQLFTGINFDGRGCTFAFHSLTASGVGFFFVASLGRTATTLAASTTTGGTTVTLTAANGATVGDLIKISITDAGTGNTYIHYTTVQGVTGTLISLTDVIPPGFNFAFGVDTSAVQCFVASSGGVFRNCTIDGANSSNANISAMGVAGNIGCLLENLEFTSWQGNGFTSATGGGGLGVDACYRITARNLGFYSCGSLASSVYFRVGTSTCDNIVSRNGGFGPQWQFGSYNTVSNVHSHFHRGRALKVNACLQSNFNNITCTGSTENGFTLSNGASFNNVNNLVVSGVAGVALNQNQIWLSDQSNQFNQINNFIVFRDPTVAGTRDIQIGATDLFNTFTNGILTAFDSTSILDSSGQTIYDNVNGITAKAPITATLVNGSNPDITAPGYSDFLVVTGPTGAFSISGFTNGFNGRRFTLYNSTAQNMTITNDATSSVGNRILTLTGADVVLTGTSAAHFMFYSTQARWILMGTQG